MLDKLRVSKDYIHDIIKNLKYNDLVLEYYQRMYDERGLNVLEKKKQRIKDCNKYWLLDRYKEQKVKDFKRTNLCADKFCNNCKKVKQASRMVRFMPEIEKYRQYGLYQMVLTIPNVNGYELQESIERLLKAFKQLTRYFTGNIKIKGLDIAKWGYKGAIRSLEITYQGNEYHPHLHVLLCMTDDLGKKYIKNDYSYDRNKIRENRLFSEKEILIQKIFCLLVNGIEVNKINLKNRKIGYSCMIEKFNDDDYVEVFKYLVKGDELDPGSNEKLIMSYDNFKVLYDSLMNVRQLQGYGCFYNIKDCEISELADETYYAVINELKLKESPEVVLEKPQELVDDKEYLIISKKRIYSYLKLYHEKM